MWKLIFLSLLSSIYFLNSQETEIITEGEDGIAYKFTDAEQSTINSNAQESEFQAEVSRLMEIIVNSLYKTRDIFLRELISNANDAIGKIRLQSLTNKEVLNTNENLDIKVQVNTEQGTITILDTGIGMTADELHLHLGSVAYSGTASFVDAFAKANEGGGDGSNLIGQFGVGFYSAFLVSDEVVVISKSNDDPVQHIWQSTADGKFSISEDPRGNTLGRGTAVILKIKDDAKNFLDVGVVESTIQRYSQFIQYPIYMYSTRTETEEIAVEDESKDGDGDGDGEDDLSVSDEDDSVDAVKTVEHLNEQKPIWSRRPSQIEDKEYDSFYKSLTKDSEAPLAHTHFRAEGEIEFDSILYVPSKANPQMYDQYYNTKSSLQLYVRRVLVADEFEDIVPRYLNFVKGLVDSNDLPLNVNREDLQKSKVMTVISRKLTRKVLDMLRKMAQMDEPDEDEEDGELEEPVDKEEEEAVQSKYLHFWSEYGKSIKLGCLEDQRNRKRLYDLLRFPSSKAAEVSPISLTSYIRNMQPGQKHIYYISGASIEEVEKSPFLERFQQRDWEVLYFIDNLDEYLNLQEYDEVPFQSITKDGVDMNGQRMKQFLEDKEKEFEDLKTWLKEIYGRRVSRIQLSSTLQRTPMAVATAKYGASAHMDKITRSQAFGAGQGGMRATKILQLNYRHPIIIELQNRIENGQGEENQELVDISNMLLDVALIQSGFDIDSEEQLEFGERVHRIVGSGLDVGSDAQLEDVPEFYDEIDEDDEDEEYEEEDDDEVEEIDVEEDVETGEGQEHIDF